MIRKRLYIFTTLLCILLMSCRNVPEPELDAEPDTESTTPPLSEESIDAVFTLSFSSDNNAELLGYDLEPLDSSATDTLRYNVIVDAERSNLIATFTTTANEVYVDDTLQESGVTPNDFSEEVTYRLVYSDETEFLYVVSVESIYNGLPAIVIDTNGEPIVSKDYYIDATITVLDDAPELALATTGVSIKGRGNTTWSMPKKPYRLKFDSKEALGGFPEDKSWVLLANYSDKSALRTSVAFALSELTNLDYTPRWKFYDLYLNEEYQGCYLLSEHKKISEDRVNVGDDGFLLEVDQISRIESGDVYFETNRILLNIKDSNDVEYGSEEYEWIKGYMTEAEEALFSEDFTDSDIGYAKYLNVESFADWYIVNEIAKNNDANFYSSCMMSVTKDGVISMGPVWDFDIAFGNCNYNSNYLESGFWVKNGVWINRLFKDPAFVSLVNERFEVVKQNIDQIYTLINENEEYLTESQVANNLVWETFGVYVWPNYVWFDTYPEEVEYLRSWLSNRMTWLEQGLSDLL